MQHTKNLYMVWVRNSVTYYLSNIAAVCLLTKKQKSAKV